MLLTCFRSTPSPLVLANPSDFMSAMTHLRTSNSGAAASGSTEIRVEGVSSVTAKETAKSTVTESSGSISIKTTGSDHEITGERIVTYVEDGQPLTVRSTARDYIFSRDRRKPLWCARTHPSTSTTAEYITWNIFR